MRLIPLLLVGLLAALPATAEPIDIVRFGTAVQTYHRQPNPEAMVDAFDRLAPAELTQPDLPVTLGAFFAHLIDADPRLADRLVEDNRTGSVTKRDIVVQALAYSHHPRREQLITEVASDGTRFVLPPDGWDFRRLAVTQALDLDLLWASFFATGDQAYVWMIADTLDHFRSEKDIRRLAGSAAEDPAKRTQLRRALIAHAAVWGLKVNARDDPRVREALKAYVDKGMTTASMLAGVILTKNPPRG